MIKPLFLFISWQILKQQPYYEHGEQNFGQSAASGMAQAKQEQFVKLAKGNFQGIKEA